MSNQGPVGENEIDDESAALHKRRRHGATRRPAVVGVDDEQLDDVLDAISSETARTLLSEIYSDAGTPSELSDRTDLSIQNLSYHLDNLEDSGLIRIAGTQYLEKDREINIYAPADRVVVFVGTQER